MPPFLAQLLTGLGVGGLDAILGSTIGADDRQKAFDLSQQGAQQVLNLDPNQLKLAALNPDMTGRGTELEGIGDIRNIINTGGMDDQTKALMNNIQQRQLQTSGAIQGAALQNAQMRGMGNSPLGFLGGLVGAQGAAGNASNAGMQALADAANRKQMAINQLYGMGSNLQGQDTGLAEAQSNIQRFNSGMLERLAEAKNQALNQQAGGYQGRANYNTNLAQNALNAGFGAAGELGNNQMTRNMYGGSSNGGGATGAIGPTGPYQMNPW